MTVIRVFGVLLAAVLTLSASVSAQRRPAGSAPQETAVSTTIALNVAGVSYSFTGKAVCEHLPRGSIYDTVAERWSVRQEDNERALSLTLWHPLSGGDDMMTLSISMGGKRHDVDTVKRPRSSQTTGSGNVKLVSQSNGGTFSVSARAGSGATISGTIKCDTFAAPSSVAG